MQVKTYVKAGSGVIIDGPARRGKSMNKTLVNGNRQEPWRSALLRHRHLGAFVAVLLGMMQTKVSLEQVVRLLFERRGARMETPTQVVYWVNTAGLSLPYRRLLAEMVDGLCAMDLRDHGKGLRVCLKDMPP